jgi:hypothetical protein
MAGCGAEDKMNPPQNSLEIELLETNPHRQITHIAHIA